MQRTRGEPVDGKSDGAIRIDPGAVRPGDEREDRVPDPDLGEPLLIRPDRRGERLVVVPESRARVDEAGALETVHDLRCSGEGWHARGNAVERAAGAAILPRRVLLEPLPLVVELLDGHVSAVPEHVGVPGDELLVERSRDAREVVALAVALGDRRVEQDLVEHVPEFGADLLGGQLPLDRVDELGGLLHEVARQRLVGLLLVPGAASRRDHAPHRRRDGSERLPRGCVPVVVVVLSALVHSVRIPGPTGSRRERRRPSARGARTTPAHTKDPCEN